MASLNKVMLIGNVTRDPEIRYTPKGTAVVELGLAVNRRYTADNGEKREEVTFLDVTMWSRQAELADQYLRKGNPVYIEGRLQLDTWDDKTSGQKRSKLRVVCEEMQFLGGRDDATTPRENRQERPERQQSNRPPARPPKPVDPDLDVDGDDIPF